MVDIKSHDMNITSVPIGGEFYTRNDNGRRIKRIRIGAYLLSALFCFIDAFYGIVIRAATSTSSAGVKLPSDLFECVCRSINLRHLPYQR